ncbi:hypothetical protein SMGES_00290 [Serratia marcescens]|jgi:hypothetical protein|nr:hypothetical protein SMGES_00290 [Serratia marcescens]
MLFLLILSTKKLPSSRDNVIKCQIISYVVKNKAISRGVPTRWVWKEWPWMKYGANGPQKQIDS